MTYWDRFVQRETSHLGDPCRYCGTAHDAVTVGPCPGRPSPAMLHFAIDALLDCMNGKPFRLLPLEAASIIDVLRTLMPDGEPSMNAHRTKGE